MSIQVSRQDGVQWWTIQREAQRNALNREVLEKLTGLIEAVSQDLETRVVVITGAGEKAFVAGADITEFESLSAKEAKEFARIGQDVFLALEALSQPVLAMVNGYALGGGFELALSCDIIVAAKEAKFGLPECQLGIMPGFGGTIRLREKLGPTGAAEMALTGTMKTAKELYDKGLVNHVVPLESLRKEVETLALVLAERAPQSLASIKRSLIRGGDCEREEGMSLERQLFSELFLTTDAKEGVRAFLEKRRPHFNGS